MHVIAAGLNHRTAPVDLREKVAISERHLPEMLRSLIARDGVLEAVILSTCNRTELYASLESPADMSGEELLAEFLASFGGVQAGEFAGHIYFYRDEHAAEHLMRVASGLDSMILGENQILGQVKDAYLCARSTPSTGAFLNTLFQSALATGKRVRTETAIGHGAFSVGAAAVELASHIFGNTLAGKTVLVLGAGKMSELTARHLQSRGAPAVMVTNRTHARAVSLAGQLGDGAIARRYDELPNALLQSDIVICSTAAPHPIVHRDLIQGAMRARRNRPLFLIDIAVPRDVDPDVSELPNVYLYNIDDLSKVVARDENKRVAEAARAGEIVTEAVDQFQKWRRSLEVVPLVTAVRERLEALKREEIARVRARLPHLSDHDFHVVEIALQSLTGKVAHDAITAIKECATSGESSDYDRLDAIRTAFGLDAESEDSNAMTQPALHPSIPVDTERSVHRARVQKAIGPA